MLIIGNQKSLFVIEDCLSFFKSHFMLGEIDFSLVFVPFKYHIYNIYT